MIQNGRTYAIRKALAAHLRSECIALDPELDRPDFSWLQYRGVPTPDDPPWGRIGYPAGGAVAENSQASYDMSKLSRRILLGFLVSIKSEDETIKSESETLRVLESWMDAIALNPNSIMRKLKKTGLTGEFEGVYLKGAIAGCSLVGSAEIVLLENQDNGATGILRLIYEFPDLVGGSPGILN